jgi:hypothetical protein
VSILFFDKFQRKANKKGVKTQRRNGATVKQITGFIYLPLCL